VTEAEQKVERLERDNQQLRSGLSWAKAELERQLIRIHSLENTEVRLRLELARLQRESAEL